MTIWDSKYSKKYNEVSDYLGIAEATKIVFEDFDDFVGTKKEITTEEKIRNERVHEMVKDSKIKSREKQSKIMDEYISELFNDYPNIPTVIKQKAYSKAYDVSHSSSYNEVENKFDEIVDEYMEIFELGRRTNESLSSKPKR